MGLLPAETWLSLIAALAALIATLLALGLRALFRSLKVSETSALFQQADTVARQVVTAAEEWARRKVDRVSGEEKHQTAKAEFKKLAPKAAAEIGEEGLDVLIAGKVNELRPQLAASASIPPGARATPQQLDDEPTLPPKLLPER
jgi:hypothetical protein